jgi:hypothetical protein
MVLIEDCAHVLCGESEGEPIGTIGDAAVFSWRKFLPLYDGADLVLNRPDRLQKGRPAERETAIHSERDGQCHRGEFDARRWDIATVASGRYESRSVTPPKISKRRVQEAPVMQAETSDVSFDTGCASTFIVWQPKAVTGLSALVATEPLDASTDWLTFHAIGQSAARIGISTATNLPRTWDKGSYAWERPAGNGPEDSNA